MLEIEDDRGTIRAEALVRERSGHVHNQLDFFTKGAWTLLASWRAQLKIRSVHCAQTPRGIFVGTLLI